MASVKGRPQELMSPAAAGRQAKLRAALTVLGESLQVARTRCATAADKAEPVDAATAEQLAEIFRQLQAMGSAVDESLAELPPPSDRP